MNKIFGNWFCPTVLSLMVISSVSWAQENIDSPSFDQSEVILTLGEAAEHFDELAELPESSWIRRDKSSANEDIDELIDEAIQALNIPELTSMRNQYHKVEEKIVEEKHELLGLKEKRVLAPDTDVSTLTKWTPTETLKNITATTRGDFEILIEARQDNIDAYQKQLQDIRMEMSNKLSNIGLYLPPDELELWLSSAIGDDVISMGIIFNSIRKITLKLEELTEEAGENLSFAKRYYGMLVILHRLVIHMQESFIQRVDTDILPKLHSYEKEAKNVLANTKRLMRGEETQSDLEQNIKSNRLNLRTIALYEKTVENHRDKVSDALELSKRAEEIAINTYRTVSLSASVASLIQNGVNTFATLSSLQIPEAAPFQNAEIREEFRKLTERIENDQ